MDTTKQWKNLPGPETGTGKMVADAIATTYETEQQKLLKASNDYKRLLEAKARRKKEWRKQGVITFPITWEELNQD